VSAAEPRRLSSLIAVVCILGSVVATAWQVGLTPSSLFSSDGLRSAGSLAGGLLHPDLSPSFLRRIGSLALESLLIGVAGTGLALAIGIALAIAAARSPSLLNAPTGSVVATVPVVALRYIARGLLAFFRSIPEIVWAFLFVRILGLGAGPAVAAIGITFGGIIGKLYAELLEAVDPEPARRLRAQGCGKVAVFLYGVLPLVRRQWIGYGLFRLECAIRSASILGVVGAGGLGSEIDLSIRYFQYGKLATALLAVIAYVIALEVASAKLRRSRFRWTGTLFVALGALSIAWLDIPWREVFSGETSRQTAIFVASMSNPTADSGFLMSAFGLAAETLAMAWCATAVAAVVAFALAPAAALPLTIGSYLPNSPHPRSWLFTGPFVAARACFALTRSVPALVWALIFVVWVGPGVTAGVLAISVHTVGILGRLFGEVLEEADPAPVRYIEGSGAGRVGRFLYGVLPQSAPRMLAYALFRFEVNIRVAAMVGFVGAGGLGDAIHTAISLFHMSDLAALLLVLLAVVLAVDWLGDRARLQLLLRD
jgi:phosphonate transport system permease protein